MNEDERDRDGGRFSWWSGRHTVLSLCIGSYFAVRFAQVVIGPVVSLVIETFTVSRGAVGLALTGMWIAYALSQLPSGVLADRFGERTVVVAALSITAGAALGLAGAPTFTLFAVGTILLGVGAGLYYNAATALLARESDGLGRAIGTHRIGGQLAGVIAPIVAAAVSVRYGWRSTIALGTVLAVGIGTLFVRLSTRNAPVRPDASLRALFAPGPLSDLLARPHVRRTTFLMTLVEFVGLAAMAFLPIFLIEHFGFSIGVANLLFATFFAASALSQPLGGWLSDRIGRDATATAQLFAGVIGYGALAAGGPPALALPAVLLAGVAMSATPVLQSRMLDGMDASNRGTGFGLFRTLYLLLGATGTTVVGASADAAGWRMAFGLLTVMLAVGLLTLVAIRIVGDGK